MRLMCVSLMCVAVLGAQDTRTYSTSTVDVNGNRVPQGSERTTTSYQNGSDSTELMRSINGRLVPVERTDERVVRDDASGKVVERIVHRYDANGNPIGTEKVVVEERKSGGGNSSVITTKYGTDINGSSQITERTTTQIQASGSSQTAETVVERPVGSGSLQTVEKQTVVTSKQGDNYEESATTYRRNVEGSFYEAVREVKQHNVTGGESKDNVAEYEVGPNGQMELHGQTVTTAVKRSDGSQDLQVDIYGKNVPGVFNDGHSLRLTEHQIVERKQGPGNSVVETLSVQRPTVSDPNRLGPPRELSQTVCRGKCDTNR